MKKYQIIYADPPWSYKAKNPTCKTEKQPKTCSVEYYYKTMKLKDIQALPINNIADENSCLFLWATTPMIIEAFETMKAWGL
jgi:N6-adenosine-specific RNA methylase IME4